MIRHTLAALTLGLIAAAPSQAQSIDLSDIVEVRGYRAPGAHTRVQRAVDLRGSKLREMLAGFVYVPAEARIARTLSVSPATAVLRDQQRQIAFVHAVCPWEPVRSSSSPAPDMVMLFVDGEPVTFARPDLCANPPAGYAAAR